MYSFVLKVSCCSDVYYSSFFWSHFLNYSAYQNNDITEFEKILKTNHSNIMDDPFIREHIEGESEL